MLSSGSLYIITSTFSTTKITSSTTIPMASIKPKRVRKFIENPGAMYIAANAPMRETGIATAAITVGLQDCKKI